MTERDLKRLRHPGSYLNDNMISCALRYVCYPFAPEYITDRHMVHSLLQAHLSAAKPNLANDVWVANTYFYSKLKANGYLHVARWTSKVDIFSKKYLLIPIHDEMKYVHVLNAAWLLSDYAQ